MADYVSVAREAARQAGAYLLKNRGKISQDVVDEKARNDFVTYVDRTSEQMIIEHLRSAFPSHKILAEEGTAQDTEADYRWIIDPLDGTKNFIQDVPMFAISIALQKGSEIVVGVIYHPANDEMFTAEKGSGAFLNGTPIRVSQRPFSQSLIATGFPFRAKRNLPSYLLAFEDIFLQCSGMRRCGSAALDLAYTAAGRFEGFWEIGLSIWDVAAGSLLVQEAGGVVSDFWGGNRYLKTGYIVAGNADSHTRLVKTLGYYFPHAKD